MNSITYCFKSGCISASVTYYINGWCFRFLKLSSRCSITPGPNHLPEQRVTSLEQPHSVCVPCSSDTFTAECQLELIYNHFMWHVQFSAQIEITKVKPFTTYFNVCRMCHRHKKVGHVFLFNSSLPVSILHYKPFSVSVDRIASFVNKAFIVKYLQDCVVKT